MKAGKLELYLVEDTKKLNERRKAMDLCTTEEQSDKINN